MGTHPEIENHYRPKRRRLVLALGALAVGIDDIHMVVNCHLHFDHCGGDSELVARPIFVQQCELETAMKTEDYTLPELLDAPGLMHGAIDGEAEVLSGVLIVPTLGHTDGHQSFIVSRGDGTVVVAGQRHDTASDDSADELAFRTDRDRRGSPPPIVPSWMERLQEPDPARVVFAHDNSVWEP